MGFWDVDIDLTIWHYLPGRRRKVVRYAWLKALMGPMRTVYGWFMANRTANLYVLAHNSQVCHLEAVLNDAFDPDDRGIYISDPEWIDPVYVYLAAEEKDEHVALDSEVGTTDYDAPLYLHLDAETAALGVSFIVNVPVAVVYDAARMQALIDYYKLVGKRYSIVTY